MPERVRTYARMQERRHALQARTSNAKGLDAQKSVLKLAGTNPKRNKIIKMEG